ncbi:chitin disaccharide deacetylase [Vibrio kyushuensis]|uniref:chitin disaccharide deacetylase n=1 Tax=Vibrio kyushuensis TaxID=2910249 RepID=UPI003D09D654
MKVIFNADDFGLTQGVNNGIVQSHKEGVVLSTTLMVGSCKEEHAVMLSKGLPNLKVGLHLRFTTGSPLTLHSCLQAKPAEENNKTNSGKVHGRNGQFPNQTEFWEKRDYDPLAVYEEVVAQVEHFLNLGIKLSHIDSHHHAHTHPQIGPVVEKVAKQYQVPLRGLGVDANGDLALRYLFTDEFYDKNVDLELLVSHLVSLKSGYDIVEVMCHPAYVDAHLESLSSYCTQRVAELNVLTDPRLKQRLDLHGIEVTDYSVLDVMRKIDCV